MSFHRHLPAATVLLLVAVFISNPGSVRATTLTYPDLVHRLTDMEHLATLPPDGEKTALASSYDRKSQYDAANDKYINWDANDDGHGIVRDEGDTVVLADIKGAGCIWRLWSAAATKGHLKIYLDGSDTPAVDLPFRDYFDADKGPFHFPHLVYLASGDGSGGSAFVPGSDNFVPIPFAKSCKIVGDKVKPGDGDSGWGQYFQATYTLFAPGTKVPTFSLPFSKEDEAALADANMKESQAGTDVFGPYAGEKTDANDIRLEAGQNTWTAGAKGPGAITALKVKFNLPADAEAQRTLLRQLTLRITWDGEDKPAVWTPLGDYFAMVGGAAPFSSLPVGLLQDGTFYSYWYMPYSKGYKIEFSNDSGAVVPMTVSISHAPLDRPIADFGRFHAKWHRDAFNPTRVDRKPDWTMLTTQGRGRFVGVLLHVWNPQGGWWGEGDDKFFVDGEKFPSSFGTGSEDYFGYAWSSGSRFVRPLHGQPLAEGNLGHEVDYRWHLSDQVPFQSSLDADIEKYQSDTPQNSAWDVYDLYACTPFWYLAPGGTDPYDEQPVGQRVGYWTRPVPKYTEPGVIEGENLKTVTLPDFQHWPSPNNLGPQAPGVWSNDRALFWTTDHGPGNEHMELYLPVETAGKYKIMVRFVKGDGYGVAQLTLDGNKLGDPFDAYDPKFQPSDPIDMGTVDLTAGQHVLGVTLPSKNPAIQGRALSFGVDYIKLVPQ
jgi:hypothetical protein